jgi:hypothetical protein
VVVWGALAFENSYAEAWVEGLDERRIEAQVRAALELAERTEALALHQCIALVCAAEIVAARRGDPAAPLPDRLRKLLILSPRPDERELALAARGLRRVREASPLRALWEERGDVEAWLCVVDDVARRLASGAD